MELSAGRHRLTTAQSGGSPVLWWSCYFEKRARQALRLSTATGTSVSRRMATAWRLVGLLILLQGAWSFQRVGVIGVYPKVLLPSTVSDSQPTRRFLFARMHPCRRLLLAVRGLHATRLPSNALTTLGCDSGRSCRHRRRCGATYSRMTTTSCGSRGCRKTTRKA